MARIETREALVEALHGAARLEHALCCCYLYAAFTAKRGRDEGVPAPEAKLVRDWTDTVLTVARQEMEHLGIVGNLLISIGASPDFDRHGFPWAPDVPTDLPELRLAPLSLATVERFVAFERPDFVHLSALLGAEIEGRSFEDGLAIVAAGLRADADWDCAAAWIPAEDGDGWVELAGTRVAPYGDEAGFATAARARLGRDGPGPKASSSTWAGGVLAIAPVMASGSGGPRAAIVLGQAGSPGDVEATAIRDLAARTLDHRPGPLDRDREHGDAFDPRTLAERLLAAPRAGAAATGAIPDADPPPATIGAYYRRILGGFRRLGPALFTGDPTLEGSNDAFSLVVPGWFGMRFGTIKDVEGARAAIEQIIEEGEGTSHAGATAFADPATADASHFERFMGVAAQMAAAAETRPAFDPARPAREDPSPDDVSAAPTRALMEFHDRAYAALLELLALYYVGVRDGPDGASPGHAALPHAFLPMMSMIMRSLGELLTRCGVAAGPDGAAAGPERAGPAFGPPPRLHAARPEADVVTRAAAGLRGLAADAAELAEAGHGWRIADDPAEARRRLAKASLNLGRIAEALDAAVARPAAAAERAAGQGGARP